LAYTKKTLRRLRPRARKLAVAINGVDLALARLKRMLPEIDRMELAADALDRRIPAAKKEPS